MFFSSCTIFAILSHLSEVSAGNSSINTWLLRPLIWNTTVQWHTFSTFLTRSVWSLYILMARVVRTFLAKPMCVTPLWHLCVKWDQKSPQLTLGSHVPPNVRKHQTKLSWLLHQIALNTKHPGDRWLLCPDSVSSSELTLGCEKLPRNSPISAWLLPNPSQETS